MSLRLGIGRPAYQIPGRVEEWSTATERSLGSRPRSLRSPCYGAPAMRPWLITAVLAIGGAADGQIDEKEPPAAAVPAVDSSSEAAGSAVVPAAGASRKGSSRRAAIPRLAPSAAAGLEQAAKGKVESAARELFLALLSGDAQRVAELSVVPFVLEDRTIRHADGLIEEWVRQLGSRRTDLLVLYGVEVMAPDEMEAKYGAPPARLQPFPWRTRGSWIAVGNLSGRAAVAVFRAGKSGDWRLIAYHD